MLTHEAEVASAIGTAERHDSAHLHVSGRALYADDIALPAHALHAAFALSGIAHGRIRALDLTLPLSMPGVAAIAAAADVPGENNYGSVLHDDPIFAESLVQYAGQPLFAVAASSYACARRAARSARVDYEPLPALLDIRAALAAQSYVLPSERVLRGRPDEMLAQAPRRLRGTLYIGGQDHFYLEGQIAIAVPQEDGAMLIHSSTQHPSEVQQIVAHALAKHAHDVTVQCRRMGGGFGGKETQPALIAAAAAVLAHKTGRPVKLRLDRDTDMLMTGKRHDFLADYEVGFDARRPRAGAHYHAGLTLRLFGGSVRSGQRPRGDAPGQRLFSGARADHLASLQDSHRVQHGLSRLRRPSGHDRDRADLDDIARTLGVDALACVV
jgi:xanthine dehydrogenase large subunit